MSKLKIKPTAGYVLIEPVKAERETPSGIVLPESHEEKPQKGKVLAVGPSEICDCGKGKRDAPCNVGEFVIYKKWAGNEIKIEDKEYLFVKFEDILAVEEN